MKHLFSGLLLMAFSLLCGAKTVTDSLGRTVTVPDDPQRIVLGENGMLYTLALIKPVIPAARVVGWPADLQRLDSQTWENMRLHFRRSGILPLSGTIIFTA